MGGIGKKPTSIKIPQKLLDEQMTMSVGMHKVKWKLKPNNPVTDGLLQYEVYDDNSAYIHLIFTHFKNRGSGIATQLLSEFLKKTDANNMRVTLLADSDNGQGDMPQDTLEKWYKKFGFKEDKNIKIVGSGTAMYRNPH